MRDCFILLVILFSHMQLARMNFLRGVLNNHSRLLHSENQIVSKSNLSTGEAADTISEFGTISSPLLESVRTSSLDGIINAIKAGENINIQNIHGWTPIMLAVHTNDFNTVKMLIELGADVNIADELGYSPLAVAAQKADIQIVKLLLSANADPIHQTRDGVTVFELAVESGRKVVALSIAEAAVLKGLNIDDSSIVAKYLGHEAFVNIQNKDGIAPLQLFVKHADYNACVRLIEQNPAIMIDLVDVNGETALHSAVENNSLNIVKLLLHHEANPTIKNKSGKSPKDLSHDFGFDSITFLFREYQKR